MKVARKIIGMILLSTPIILLLGVIVVVYGVKVAVISIVLTLAILVPILIGSWLLY